MAKNPEKRESGTGRMAALGAAAVLLLSAKFCGKVDKVVEESEREGDRKEVAAKVREAAPVFADRPDVEEPMRIYPGPIFVVTQPDVLDEDVADLVEEPEILADFRARLSIEGQMRLDEVKALCGELQRGEFWPGEFDVKGEVASHPERVFGAWVAIQEELRDRAKLEFFRSNAHGEVFGAACGGTDGLKGILKNLVKEIKKQKNPYAAYWMMARHVGRWNQVLGSEHSSEIEQLLTELLPQGGEKFYWHGKGYGVVNEWTEGLGVEQARFYGEAIGTALRVGDPDKLRSLAPILKAAAMAAGEYGWEEVGFEEVDLQRAMDEVLFVEFVAKAPKWNATVTRAQQIIADPDRFTFMDWRFANVRLGELRGELSAYEEDIELYYEAGLSRDITYELLTKLSNAGSNISFKVE